MADEVSILPMKSESSEEETREAAMRKLEDATHEPASLVEQGSDYRQAELIQAGLIASMPSVPIAAPGESGGATANNVSLPGGDIHSAPCNPPHPAKPMESTSAGAPADGPETAHSPQQATEFMSRDYSGVHTIDQIADKPGGNPLVAESQDFKGMAGEPTRNSREQPASANQNAEPGDLTSEKQLRLQMMMEQKTQIEQTLSNVEKKFEDTQRDLIANLK